VSTNDAPEPENRPGGAALLLHGIEHAAALAFGIFLALLALCSREAALSICNGRAVIFGVPSADPPCCRSDRASRHVQVGPGP
jgi:hypothetical protein